MSAQKEHENEKTLMSTQNNNTYALTRHLALIRASVLCYFLNHSAFKNTLHWEELSATRLF